MKAKELMEVLQKLDPETLIIVDGYEGDYSVPKRTEQIYVTGPHENVPWYYGNHKVCLEDDPNKITALVIRR
jgi:hypothetical protein